MTPEQRAQREALRAADHLLPSPGSNCQRGAHEACLFVVDCPCACHDADALMTAEEHAVVRQAGELWGHIRQAIPDGPTRDADLRELIGHVHAIQHTFMAQAAARAYPDLYRALGSTIQKDNDR